MENPSEAILRAELEEAREALETVSGSLRFQIGDAIVSAFSGNRTLGGRVRALAAAGSRARALLAYSRIRSKVFSGLPRDGLPKFPASLPIQELRALERFVSVAAKSGSGLAYAGPGPSAPWSTALVALVTEFLEAINKGYDLSSLPNAVALSSADKQRIVYVTQHDPEKSFNGYARRTREIVRGLEARGFCVATTVTAGGHAESLSAEDIPVQNAGLRAHVDSLASIIGAEALRHRAGLIHCASNYLNGLAAICAARTLGIPCVYEVRGLWEETRRAIDTDFGDTLGYQLQAAMEVFCADNADVTIVGSAGIGDELARRGASAKRFFLAESGSPDVPAVSSCEGIAQRKLFPAGSRVLGFIGSVTSYEGFETIAKALAILSARDPRYRMLIVGGGPFLSEAKSIFSRAGVGAKTLFAGKLPFDAALSHYREIDLALYPRDSTRVTEIVESLKPVEAVAAGVPVIVSNVRPLAAFTENCPAAFEVRASNANDLASAVESFFSKTDAQRFELSQGGREWAASHRRWAHTVEAIETAYAGLGELPDKTNKGKAPRAQLR